MIVNELIEILNQFDKNLEIGGTGHFREILRIDNVTKVTSISDNNTYVSIEIKDKGSDPGKRW